MAGPTFSNMFNPNSGYVKGAKSGAEWLGSGLGHIAGNSIGSNPKAFTNTMSALSDIGNAVSEGMGSVKSALDSKGLARRQNIIKQNEINSKLEHEKWLADRADGMPRDWGTALKDAGGGSGAALRVGANAVAGGVAGGAIDGSMGNDSWSDGAMAGAALGGLLGAGSFAHSVNKLKVGKYTPVVNGGTTISYEGPHSVNRNTGTYDKSKAPIHYTGKSATDRILKNNNWTLQEKTYDYDGPSVDFNLTGHEKNSLAAKRMQRQGFGW